MNEQTLETFESILRGRGFSDVEDRLNTLWMIRHFGDDLAIVVWARDWSSVIAQVCNPSSYDSACTIIETEDQAAFTQIIDALIQSLSVVAKYRPAKEAPPALDETCGDFSHVIPDDSDRCKCGKFTSDSKELFSFSYGSVGPVPPPQE